MNKWATIAGVILIAGFCALALIELAKSGVPRYTLVSQVMASEGRKVRFTGSIVANAARFDSDNNILRFQMSDSKGAKLTVVYEGVKPAGFDAAPTASVVGAYRDGEFAARQLALRTGSGQSGK